MNEQKEIWFNDDVWGIIKEYAGIYNITTEWYKVFSKVGLNKLHNWYKTHCGYRISNIDCKGAEKGKLFLMKCFMSHPRTKNQYVELNKLITAKRRVVKREDDTEDFSIYKIGQEVSWFYGYDYKCGVIQKVNKNSLTVKFYEEHEGIIQDPEGLRKYLYSDVKYYYNKEVFEEKNTVIYKYFKADFELDDNEKYKLLYRLDRLDYGR